MKLEHITINVASLEESVPFYQKALGLAVITDMRKTSGLPIVFLAQQPDDPKIELIENPGQAYSGAGLSIGFHVADAKQLHQQLTEGGFHPTDFVSPAPGVSFFFVKDPNGVTIQLM